MATSSITHNFVLSDSESIRNFIWAIEEAEKEDTPKKGRLPGYQITDPEEILELMAKRQK